MVPSALFTVVLLVYLGLTCLIGGLCGAITSRFLRLHWKAIMFLQDMVIAGLASFLAAAMFIEIENRRLTPFERGNFSINPWIFVTLGSAVPLFRHLIRFASSRTSGAAHQSR